MQHIMLDNGRQISWHEWGAKPGTPVLFCTGAGMAGSFPFGEDAAQKLGLTVLSVDRPGLGWSDPDPAKSFDSWVADVSQMLAALGVGAVPVIGFSQGAAFAFALAAAGVASQLAVVAGQDELADPRVMALLPEQVAEFTRRAVRVPDGLEAEIAASATPEWLWSMIDTMSAPADREVFAHPDFAKNYRAALEAGFRRGALGYARDTVLALSHWPFRLEEVRCPVDLWYGLEDTSPVHSPDHGLTLSKRLPRATRHALQSVGSSLLWTEADKILGAISARL